MQNIENIKQILGKYTKQRTVPTLNINQEQEISDARKNKKLRDKGLQPDSDLGIYLQLKDKKNASTT